MIRAHLARAKMIEPTDDECAVGGGSVTDFPFSNIGSIPAQTLISDSVHVQVVCRLRHGTADGIYPMHVEADHS